MPAHLEKFGVEVMKIPVIQMTTSERPEHEHLKYSDCRPLPASYMSEYSVLGLVVDKLDLAVRILSANGLLIDTEAFGAEADIGDPAQVTEMVGMLAEAGIYCSIGDVIDSVYEG
jgi:hypothetical protein